jgi:hypothetical protein
MSKVCSKCDETKPVEAFISRDRCICKTCKNASNREKYNTKKLAITSDVTKPCINCEVEKPLTEFIHPTNRCKECNNNRRREEYHTDEAINAKLKEKGRDYKRRKTEARQKARAEEKAKLEAEIGDNNTICKYCKEVVPKTHFRHNRLKCKDCERDDPIEKFKRGIRTRIWWCLNRKEMHTIEYLGCTFPEYEKWILSYSPEFTMENRGTVWHIDHIIPISHFDMNDPAQQLIAFNWRNTAPLLARDNLAKNNRILSSQIEQHLSKLNEYHITHNIEFPIEFSNLFATRPNCGKPL